MGSLATKAEDSRRRRNRTFYCTDCCPASRVISYGTSKVDRTLGAQVAEFGVITYPSFLMIVDKYGELNRVNYAGELLVRK